jgi:hypothetical protein
MVFQKYKTSFVLFIFALSTFNCISNYEPVISEITADPNPVVMGGLVSLRCIASDEDESSIRAKDSITYDWSASAGSFVVPETIDYILHPSKIYWAAVDSSGMETDTGYYTITCQVNDENNAVDILSIIVKVE